VQGGYPELWLGSSFDQHEEEVIWISNHCGFDRTASSRWQFNGFPSS